MNVEQWEDLATMITEKFEVFDRREETTSDGAGVIDVIEFQGPLGRMKIEFMRRPKVVERKMIVSKRIGAGGKEENVYDESQMVNTMKAYRWEEQGELWQELEADNLDLS